MHLIGGDGFEWGHLLNACELTAVTIPRPGGHVLWASSPPPPTPRADPMIGKQNAAQQELLGVVGWGRRGMGHRPLSSFPLRGRATLAGLDPGSLGAAPEGGRPGRRRPTHPPPQEAERCTWRPVLQLSPETGPAGRE